MYQIFWYPNAKSEMLSWLVKGLIVSPIAGCFPPGFAFNLFAFTAFLAQAPWQLLWSNIYTGWYLLSWRYFISAIIAALSVWDVNFFKSLVFFLIFPEMFMPGSWRIVCSLCDMLFFCEIASANLISHLSNIDSCYDLWQNLTPSYNSLGFRICNSLIS